MWGVSTFENDIAVNWFKEIVESNNVDLILNQINNTELKEVTELTLDECTILLAAIEIVAAEKVENYKAFPMETIEWFIKYDFPFTKKEEEKSKALLKEILKESEIKELYIDSPLFTEWNKSIQLLASKLGVSLA